MNTYDMIQNISKCKYIEYDFFEPHNSYFCATIGKI